MKRRLDKRRHQRFLIDTLCEVSQSGFWRPRIVEAGGNFLAVNSESANGLPLWLVRYLHRWHLKYQVRVVPHAQTKGWQGYEELIMFEVSSERYPTIREWSANNPETIYLERPPR